MMMMPGFFTLFLCGFVQKGMWGRAGTLLGTSHKLQRVLAIWQCSRDGLSVGVVRVGRLLAAAVQPAALGCRVLGFCRTAHA